MTDASRELLDLQEALAGRYSLEREIARSPVAIEFLARDVALDRPVSIKLLRERLASDPDSRARFLRAARAGAGLFHPNVVPTHAVEELGERVFAVMTHVEAETLEERVRRTGPPGPRAVRRIVEEVAWALSHAHSRGVIHGDLGPDSILIEVGSERTLVRDFGLAGAADVAAQAGREDHDGSPGAPGYVSPEGRDGRALGPRSDLYSLGAAAHFALTGRAPGRTGAGAAAPPQRWRAPAASELDPELAGLLDACLEEEPQRRPASALALAQAAADRTGLPSTLPPAARRLLRRISQFSPVVGIGLLALWVLRGGPVELLFTPVVALGFAWVGAGLLRSAREVLREGLDADVIRRILVEEARELAAHPGESSHRLQNLAIGCGGWLVALTVLPMMLFTLLTLVTLLGGGSLVGLGAFWAAFLTDKSVAGLLLLTLLFLAGPAEPEDSPLRRLDWGERMMVGHFGRLLFWFAGVGLRGGRQGAEDVGQPTEVVLSATAEELFRALPPALREHFGDVPATLRDLLDHARQLHRHDDALAEALTRLDAPSEDREGSERATGLERTREELEAARARVRARLGEVGAALEHVRLNLLRFSAGSGTVEELTVDLSRARELGDDADDLAAAHAEVQRLLEAAGQPATPQEGQPPGQRPARLRGPARPPDPRPRSGL